MRDLPVRWSEGLFLRPHHFQAADRHWAESQQTSEHWDHEYNYGVRTLELSDEAIANGQVQVDVCHARMKDGTLISLDQGQAMDRVDLGEAFENESEVDVFLAVPKLQLGSANVSTEGSAGKTRYSADVQSPPDEDAGGNNQEVPFRNLNVRLLLSTQDTEGYELLQIARIHRAGSQEAAPELDDSFFPPMLAIDAWAPLGRDVVRAIYDVIGKRVESLKKQVVTQGISLASQQPGDLERLIMLSQLNEAYARLRVLTFASGVHPFVAYMELCGIVGKLAIFGPDRRVPDSVAELPYYNHDDLATIFYCVKKLIEDLEPERPKVEYEPFVGQGLGMAVTIKSRWFDSDWKWYVGVARTTQDNLSDEDCHALLTGRLNWKLGSEEEVDRLFINGMPGVELTTVSQAPSALPPHRNVSYYQVTRGNAAWNSVVATGTLAMRLERSLIANRDQLQGKKDPLEVSIDGKKYSLKFGLFAVQTRT